ncbi:hypothetical protein XELAEV_18012501mg [Xenopus laevis]|uniref:GIY-YIG domain-containing protein n=1 Tax=Xenopus laevis TaxID=8355 RepID=A0A974DPJ9_XENLA|nr:hypothetical protein XELAEV_18012501mg [Xenopus laevis]
MNITLDYTKLRGINRIFVDFWNSVKRRDDRSQKQLPKNEIRIISYSMEHNQITNILTKHWYILEQDKILKEMIGKRPVITFRRSKNLRVTLLPPLNPHGYLNVAWDVRSVATVLHVPLLKKPLVGCLDIDEFKLMHFMNCKTTGVVYIMKRVCNKLYVGKTRREFRRRILEHVGDVRNKHNTSVADHINEFHDGNVNIMKFFAVEHFQLTTRVGDIEKKLLHCEAKWIYWLNSRSPSGLNEGFTFKPFL